jgi:BlaI family transcriptional regulator, penicillinase repressor
MKPPRPRAPHASAPPGITDAEWIVMRVFWEKQQATANEVVAALDRRTDWKPKTIHTLIRRLAQKGALAYQKRGKEYLFRPLVKAEQCAHAVSRSFLDRIFGGRVAPFLACLLEQERLSPQEIAELRKLLEEKS